MPIRTGPIPSKSRTAEFKNRRLGPRTARHEKQSSTCEFQRIHEVDPPSMKMNMAREESNGWSLLKFIEFSINHHKFIINML